MPINAEGWARPIVFAVLFAASSAVAQPNTPLAKAMVLTSTSEPMEVLIVPDWQASPPKASFVMSDASGHDLGTLPDAPLVGDWAFDDVQSFVPVDLNGDGNNDLLAVLTYVTGIGPTGMEPFAQVIAYLKDGDSFRPAPELTQDLNETGDLGSLDAVVASVRAKAATGEEE